MLKLRKGFTLIEIMVVISVLGIIIAIVVPRLMDKKETKKMNPLQSEKTEKVIDQTDTSFWKQLSIHTNKKYKITIWNEVTGAKETRWFIVEEAE